MSNTVRSLYNLTCPACGSDEFLQVMIETWADLSTEGTEPFGDHEWNEYSSCRCVNCGFDSAVEKFRATSNDNPGHRLRDRRAFRMGPHIHPSRAAYDYYPTPPEATRALLAAEQFDGSIWEPACGEGHLAKVLTDAGYDVTSTDLVDYGFGTPSQDFLAERKPLAKHIVTNPPYGRGLAEHSPSTRSS
jgi:predicted nucleic-acid-binding Zn-ribbon protein